MKGKRQRDNMGKLHINYQNREIMGERHGKRRKTSDKMREKDREKTVDKSGNCQQKIREKEGKKGEICKMKLIR
jgi:hypothetical protein